MMGVKVIITVILVYGKIVRVVGSMTLMKPRGRTYSDFDKLDVLIMVSYKNKLYIGRKIRQTSGGTSDFK